MNFFNQLERKYRKYAINNLMYYIVILYAIGLIIQIYNPMIYFVFLSLDPQAILSGEIWRIITFLIYPPAFASMQFTDILFGVIALYLYYSLGNTLERVLGAFRFNVFFFTGVFAQVLASIITYLIVGYNIPMATGFLNFSIFLAFAMSFPNAQFLMFFVIPVKAKWLAIAQCVILVYSFFTGGFSTKVEIIVSLANIVLFAYLTGFMKQYGYKNQKRKQSFKNAVKQPKNPQGTRHKCAVCGRTEKDDPNLEFRYCSKCEGGYEYCQDHIYTHQHVKKQ